MTGILFYNVSVILISFKLITMSSLKLFKRIENYFVSRLLLLKLESHELIGKLVVLMVSSFLFISFVMIILFFLGITCALFIGELLGSTVYGFAVTTLFFIVVLLAIVIYREKIIENPIMDVVIRELNKPEKDEEKSKK